MIDYAQHGIKLAQLLRRLDDHCLSNKLDEAHAVSLDVIAEARLLSLSIREMQKIQAENEQRRNK